VVKMPNKKIELIKEKLTADFKIEKIILFG